MVITKPPDTKRIGVWTVLGTATTEHILSPAGAKAKKNEPSSYLGQLDTLHGT
jgi:hypothetical protein